MIPPLLSFMLMLAQFANCTDSSVAEEIQRAMLTVGKLFLLLFAVAH